MQQRTLTMEGENPLGVRPIKGLLFSFSIPAIISCLVNSVYNIVDQIFIGQGVGYLGNAATTIAFPLMTIIMAFATLIGSGGSAYAALRLGEGRKREALLTLNNLLVIAIGLGILLAATGLIFLKPILTLFGATETTMPYAIDYTSIVLMGVPFSVISIALSNMARTDGHPRMSMYGILIGAALNTVLDPIYIFVLDWGVKGAAIATITAQFVSTVVLCYYFLRKGNMRFTRRYMKPVGRVWYKIFSLGISSGITSLVACIMQVVMNNSLVYYGNQTEITGDVALSAMGIVMKIAMILASVCIGFGIGAQPILGFNLGAKKYARVRHTYLLAVSIATGSILIGWAVCQLAPHLVLSLFGKENQTFTDFAVRCLRIYLGGIFCAGFQIVSTNYFQATGQPLKASLLSMLRQLILLIPLLLILPLFFGLNGLLYAGPCADIGSAVIVALFILPEMRKLNRRIAESQGPALAA
ncbi:MATE family efflux transporter [Anaerotignum lactatifermentans]|uniref:MATE family efflux transporter n=1 Tax=Anaerotignum lactatifermentans TaxID=160404 RepID=UPI0018761510|nr:MATE family efflux transporter [Anaerotignum lactatifermentans]MBE5075480.1 MATE family efflux transporter [Anaerotignum lactatifermentans]